MISRRAFIGNAALGLLLAPLLSEAQQTGKVWRIGYLSPSSPTREDGLPLLDAVRQGLVEMGYVEGRNIAIESRFASGNFEQLPDLATQLVGLKVDVIVAMVTAAALAAKKAAGTIPVVMVGVGDPVGSGLVASLAHPGGNITGTSSMAPEVVGKQLEALKAAVPEISRVSVLWNPANWSFQTQQVNEAKAAAQAMRVELEFFEARSPHDFDPAFAALTKKGARALLVLLDVMLVTHYRRIAEFAVRHRLPNVSGAKQCVEAGGLMAYGPSYSDLHRRAARYLDKLFRGAKPADLPVEQPTKFELVINLRTAKALGLTIPPSLLLRADEVIR